VNIEPGMRVLLSPIGSIVTDPYWIKILAVAPDGSVTIADEEGMEDTVDAREWAESYVSRIVRTEEAVTTKPGVVALPAPEPEPEGWVEPDEGGMDDEPAPPAESVPGEEAYAPLVEPAPEYVARNAEQSAASEPGIDPTDHAPTELEQLADLVNRQMNCESMARKFQTESMELSTESMELSIKIGEFLKNLAKRALLKPAQAPAEDIPFGKSAVDQAMKEMVEKIEPPAPEPVAAPTPKKPIAQAAARAIADRMAEQSRQKVADSEYAQVARLEMNRNLKEIKGITEPNAVRLAGKGIKTLAQFAQAAEESPDGWWKGITYISAERAAQIEGCIEAHWKVFKARYGKDKD